MRIGGVVGVVKGERGRGCVGELSRAGEEEHGDGDHGGGARRARVARRGVQSRERALTRQCTTYYKLCVAQRVSVDATTIAIRVNRGLVPVSRTRAFSIVDTRMRALRRRRHTKRHPPPL